MSLLASLLEKIIISKKNQSNSPFLLCVSGIDASGKGYISNHVQNALIKSGHTSYLFHLDGYLNLPEIRFSINDPAMNFYQNGFRWDELKEQLLIPYRKNDNLNYTMNYLEETWTNFEKIKVYIKQVDFLILEGIFLFRDELMQFYSETVWIDCSFETALKRALNRNQEGLDKESIQKAYDTIYLPAQKIHFLKDDPKQKASYIFVNDFYVT